MNGQLVKQDLIEQNLSDLAIYSPNVRVQWRHPVFEFIEDLIRRLLKLAAQASLIKRRQQLASMNSQEPSQHFVQQRSRIEQIGRASCRERVQKADVTG